MRPQMGDVAHGGRHIDDVVTLHYTEFIVVEECQLHGSPLYSTGTKIECRIFPPTDFDRWPFPVMSSPSTPSPAPIVRASPSLAVICTPPSRLMMYCRRGAGCHERSYSPPVSRKMMPVAGRRFDSLLPLRSSTHSTSTSRQWVSPASST